MMNSMQSNDKHSVADLDSARELELTPSSQCSGTLTQPNSQTRYLEFESATPTELFPAFVGHVDPPPESTQSTTKPRQPARKQKPSKRLKELKKNNLEGRRDRGKHSELEVTLALQQFEEQLRLLEKTIEPYP
jgi:hypothetical protein